jgi:AmmeMemoRadiSam system protein B
MREPVVAGMFYPASEKALRKELSICFSKGPGRERPGSGPRVIGLVSPHAGYTYSGPTAAYGYLAIADGGLPATAVIVGPNHTGLGEEMGLLNDDIKTPLGTAYLDRDLAGSLDVPPDRASHAQEHSMEVQVPFLQYLDPGIKQVCISMMDQSPGGARSLAKKIVEGVRSTSSKVVLIASSDFTHCGPNYGVHVPRASNAGETARSMDMPVIDRLLEMDVQGAYDARDRTGSTACGLGPVAAVILASKGLGSTGANLLNYTTSYDVMPHHSAVGYASISLV